MPGRSFCYVPNNVTVLLFPLGESLLYSKANNSQKSDGAKVIGEKQQKYRQAEGLQQMLRPFSKSFTAPEILHPFAARQKKCGPECRYSRRNGKGNNKGLTLGQALLLLAPRT